MDNSVIKENEFTFNKDEVCAEDCENKTLWLLKLAYDFDVSSLPWAVPLSCFTKTDNFKDLTGAIFVPSKNRRELEKFTLSGEMTIDTSLNILSSEAEESKSNERSEKEKKTKRKRHKLSDVKDVTKIHDMEH